VSIAATTCLPAQRTAESAARSLSRASGATSDTQQPTAQPEAVPGVAPPLQFGADLLSFAQPGRPHTQLVALKLTCPSTVHIPSDHSTAAPRSAIAVVPCTDPSAQCGLTEIRVRSLFAAQPAAIRAAASKADASMAPLVPPASALAEPVSAALRSHEGALDASCTFLAAAVSLSHTFANISWPARAAGSPDPGSNVIATVAGADAVLLTSDACSTVHRIALP